MNYWWLQTLPCRWDILRNNGTFLACTWQAHHPADQKPADLCGPGRSRLGNLGRCRMGSIPYLPMILPMDLPPHKDVKHTAKKTNIHGDDKTQEIWHKMCAKTYFNMRFDVLTSVMMNQVFWVVITRKLVINYQGFEWTQGLQISGNFLPVDMLLRSIRRESSEHDNICVQ
jgi:hypothetical protein